MRTYIGECTNNGLYVWVDEEGKKVALNMRTDLREHLPSGLEFGRLRSCQAQLALAIICDHLEHNDHERRLIQMIYEIERSSDDRAKGTDFAALAIYEDFKSKVTAALSSWADWRLSSSEVSRAIREIYVSRKLARSGGQ
jgi:hypothetical protein